MTRRGTTTHPSRRLARGTAGAALLAALGAWTLGCARGVPASERSLILVTLDTTRADHIGAFGGKAVPTPNIDAAAREGVIFEEAISQVPLTLPSHSSMMTGQYPASHGVRHNGIYRLRSSETTLAEHLKSSGFETAAFVGSFVLNRGFGLEQGFDTYDDVAVDRFQGGRDRVFEAQRTADEVNARVFDWISRPHPGRFFLWVHYYDPHDPYEPPEKEGRRLEGKGYDREISYVDFCFGDLVSRLRGAGLLDRSILVVAGDHGESLGEHGERTHGVFLYEGAVHVPLFIRAPGIVRAGERVSRPVELVDIAPTALDLLGLPPLPAAQGKSLRARIEGADDGRGAQAHAETMLPRLEFGWSELRMVRDATFKYIQAPRPELYDLERDPGEAKDLARDHPERAGAMAAALSTWAGATSSPEAAAASRRTLTAEEEERLRSLGYLSGDFFKKEKEGGASLLDPKDGIAEVGQVAKSRDLLRAGDAEGALAQANAVLVENSNNHAARNAKILALVEMRRFGEAETEARAAVTLAERDAEASGPLLAGARSDLAGTLRLEGKTDEAEAEYRRIVASDPTNVLARLDLARILVESGRLDEPRTIVDETLRRDSHDGMAMAVRYLIEDKAGHADAALRAAEALADARSGDAPTLAKAARRLLDAGQPLRAVACLEAAQQQTRPNPDLLGLLGMARLRAGGLVPARAAFLAVVQLRPDDARPHFFLGYIALKMGDESTARGYFARALELDPKFSTPLVTLGRWLLEHGRRDEALRTVEEALRRNPADIHARQLLEQVRAAAG